MKPDLSKSLQQLDGQDWGEPKFDSHVVTECHRLRRVPLCDLTIEDLRLMIAQNFGLEHLIPLGLDRLDENPFAEVIYYPGDLLVSVLAAEARFWRTHQELRERLMTITERAISLFPTIPDIADETVTEAVTSAYEQFQRLQKPLT